jgi:hypothetical protein
VSELEEFIQDYLSAIVYLSPRKLPMNRETLAYLSGRVHSAFSYELGDRKVGLQLDPYDNSNIILTLI